MRDFSATRTRRVMAVNSLGLILLVIILITGAAYAQPSPPVLWGHTFGTNRGAEARAVRQMTDGSYVVAGLAGPATDYAVGNQGYVVKLNSEGDTLWTRRYSNGEDDRFFSLEAMGEGGFVLVGLTATYANSNDFWVIRCNADGDTIWTRTFGGWMNDQGYAITATSDGGLAVAGIDATSGAGRYEEYLVKLDADGNIEWQHGYGVPAINVEARSVHECADGGFIVSGGSTSYGSWNTPFNMFVIRTNEHGEARWSRQYGGAGNEFATDAVCMDDNGFVIVGYTTSRGHGGEDIMLIRVNADGNPVWTRVFGGPADDAGYEIRHAHDGGFIIGGVTASAGHGGSDLLLLKVNNDGHRQWARVYGTAASEFPWSNQCLELSNDSSYVLAGTSVHNHNQMFVVKTGPDHGVYASDPYDPDITEIAEEVLSSEPAPVPAASYALLPNYPNPFNPATVIPFDLKQAGFVSLKVYNVLGQEVASLVSGHMDEGHHTITFNGANLPSGLYVYRLSTNGFTAESKMMLLK